jgi:predicted branched-subunit amino acid permease
MVTAMTEPTTTTICRELRAAVADLSPALVAAVPIGLLVGAMATTKGLSPVEAIAMSFAMFSGGAQLAAIELWRDPVPITALVFSTLLINVRFLLMSASLAPKLPPSSLAARLVGFHALADENWALSERRAAEERAAGRRITAAYVFGQGWVFVIGWVAATAVGALLGPLLGDPRRLGADFAFTAIFIGLIAGFARRRGGVAVVVASALAAALAHRTLGTPWHIVAGAAAGLAVAALSHRPDPATVEAAR